MDNPDVVVKPFAEAAAFGETVVNTTAGDATGDVHQAAGSANLLGCVRDGSAGHGARADRPRPRPLTRGPVAAEDGSVDRVRLWTRWPRRSSTQGAMAEAVGKDR